MAVTALNIFGGSCTVEIAPYVAPANGTTVATGFTWADVGATFGPTTLEIKRTYHDFKPEQYLARIGAIKTGDEKSIKFGMMEATLANLARALDIPTTLVSGGVLSSKASAVLQQIALRLVGPGVWTNATTQKTRTALIWKALISDVATIGFNRNEETKYMVTANIYQESILTSATLADDIQITEA